MSTTKKATPSVTSAPSAKDKITALRAQIKSLRDETRKAAEARRGESKAERVETAKKYIAIFTERANRLRAKAAKADELVALLKARITKLQDN